jgi:hypothetical protein
MKAREENGGLALIHFSDEGRVRRAMRLAAPLPRLHRAVAGRSTKACPKATLIRFTLI